MDFPVQNSKSLPQSSPKHRSMSVTAVPHNPGIHFCRCYGFSWYTEILWPSESWKGMVCFSYTSTWLLHSKGSLDRNPSKTGTWWQKLKQRQARKRCLLFCSPWLAKFLSYAILDHQPRGGPTQTRWAPPHQSLIKKITQTCWQLNFMEAFSQQGIPVLQWP